ncbi:MAG: TonB-dependent receptor [Pseudazoarcus pumilus]|nr:TonB-dependent receptor [Pseudazoarcus pumilus]
MSRFHPFPSRSLRPGVLAVALAFGHPAFAQTTPAPDTAEAPAVLDAVTVNASADASAEGLTPVYAGGQVARGGRVGLLGNRDTMETPFNANAYTSELMQDQQARNVSDVLQNDPSVRTARGFGNFQELYIIRGFQVYSDDIAYNGLYGLLPRQYVATELLERVEVLRGANSFVNGAAPGGSGIGGAVNLLPKRAPNEPLTRLTTGIETGGQVYVAADIGRRFGPDDANGIRLNVARRDGDTAIDDESRRLDVVSVGLDHRGANYRLSADLGYQDHDIDQPRPSITPSGRAPKAADADDNFAQPWTYSKERQVFATFRGEFDLNDDVTAWAAAGMRRGDEKNRLANPRAITANGTGTAYRFDNVREDEVATGEVGVRARMTTGTVSHELVASANAFHMASRNAYAGSSSFATDIYDPTDVAMPPTSAFSGGSMSSPHVTERVDTRSFAVADTLSFIDDRLLVTVGARQQRLISRGYNYNTGAQTSKYDESELTPMAAVLYKLTPQVSVYANYAEALVKGDIAPATSGGNPVTNAGEVLSPYVSVQKEIGAKYDGGNLGGSVAWFTTDKPFSTVEGGVFAERGEQRNRGLEFTVYGQPTPHLRVLGGLTLLDAKLRKTAGSAQDGNDAIGVPERQLNVGLEWDVPGVPGLTLTGRAIHTSSQYIDESNNNKIPSWTRFDLGARYITDIGGQVMTLRARIDNVTNRDYWASAGGYPGANYLVLGAPRTFTLTASFDF